MFADGAAPAIENDNTDFAGVGIHRVMPGSSEGECSHDRANSVWGSTAGRRTTGRSNSVCTNPSKERSVHRATDGRAVSVCQDRARPENSCVTPELSRKKTRASMSSVTGLASNSIRRVHSSLNLSKDVSSFTSKKTDAASPDGAVRENRAHFGRASLVANSISHLAHTQPKTVHGKSASFHGVASTDVVVGHTLRSQLTQLVPRLLWMHPALVMACGLLFYMLTLVLFAIIFFALGPGCFKLSAEASDFNFLEMTWLSVHTISTVGYGSAYPICASSQLVVALESYASVLLQAVISAYVVFTLIRSRARIRFSKICLVTPGEIDPESGEVQQEVNFRLIRESHTAVRDARIYVQARFRLSSSQEQDRTNTRRRSSCASNGVSATHSVTGEKVQEVRAELEISPNQMSSLDHWHVRHLIDENSALWPIRKQLGECLSSVDVSLSAYDTAYQQEVKLYLHYKKDEIIHNRRFEPLGGSGDVGSTVTVDIAKLDKMVEERPARFLKRAPSNLTSVLTKLNLPGTLSRQKTTSFDVRPRPPKPLQSARGGCMSSRFTYRSMSIGLARRSRRESATGRDEGIGEEASVRTKAVILGAATQLFGDDESDDTTTKVGPTSV